MGGVAPMQSGSILTEQSGSRERDDLLRKPRNSCHPQR